MKNKKKIFFILCIATIIFMVFMLIPDKTTQEDGQQTVTQNLQHNVTDGSADNKPSNIPQPSKTDEWDSNEFEEDKETEILGTFARKVDDEITVFIYFDRDGVLLRETHKGSDVTKELGRYQLSESTLTMDGAVYDFSRDGDNIIIDGKTWEYLDGIILSVV